MLQTDFRDALSWKEFGLSGLCQACQDTLFIGTRDDDVRPRRYELRTGAVVATRRLAGAPLQAAFIPFVFGAPGRPAGWESRSIVYAGRSPSHAKLSDRLAPVRSFLGRHRVRICALRDFALCLPPSRYGPYALVIARDDATLRDVASLSGDLAQAGHVALEPVLRGRAGFGSLHAFVSRTGVDKGYRAAGVDPLRTCAWLAAALEFRRPDPALFDYLLSPYRIPASGSGAPVTEGC